MRDPLLSWSYARADGIQHLWHVCVSLSRVLKLARDSTELILAWDRSGQVT